MTTLETRRIRGDQIDISMHGYEGLDKNMFFRLKTEATKSALAKEHCKLDIRKYAFSQQTVNGWNKLPVECVNATSVNIIKKKLHEYFKRTRQVNN